MLGQVVEDKADLQQKMIDKEEDYIVVSKALLDLEVEKTQLQEAAETSKYEVMNKLLNAENELVKYEMRDEEMSSRVAKMKEEMAKMMDENKQLTLEFVAMKENCLNSQQDLSKMVTEKDNLSLEMFNLINAKKELMRIKEELTRQNNEKTGTITQLREAIDKVQDDSAGKVTRFSAVAVTGGRVCMGYMEACVWRGR